MSLQRVVAAETLDHLPADDPAARRSRRDLRRVHRAMGTRGILRRALGGLRLPRRAGEPLRVLELGAGDGSLMLGVARSLGPAWAPVALTLLDRQPLLDEATREAYGEFGWQAAEQVIDVLDWAGDGCASEARAGSDRAAPGGGAPRWHLIVANLFLHHFDGPQLAALLAAVAARCECFLACEPRRSALALAGSRLIGALGVNAVTREDAVLSVRAGFRDAELSAAWPGRAGDWHLREYGAGLFSHGFTARRKEAA